jgi:2-polyprenyl-6-methoxyphenol hydroxylase-like FAD-dependent oxidoreductase
MRIPPMPSNQINRFTLDERLRRRARELGVRVVEGTVEEVALGAQRAHRVVYAGAEGERVSLTADWVVDASGRRRFLANQLGLKQTPRHQRSSFWFRLAGFDRGILRRMEEVKAPQQCFDSYYVTHHFFGQANWIWAIPLRTAGGEPLISIGIVYRPDLYPGEVRSMDDFLARVGAEHPVIAQLVASGRVVDTNAYRNYFYETAQSYSEQGWFIVGDAGDTVDPLYSTGLVMTALQVKQVAAMVEADRAGRLTAELVADLERAYKTIRTALQGEISTLYEVMGDPFQSHLRMHYASAFYFYVLLPCWLAGYAEDPVGARFLTKVIEDGAPGFEALKQLMAVASRRRGPLRAEEIRNLYGETVNWQLSGPSERTIPLYVARCCRFFARQRLRLLRTAGWRGWPRQLGYCLADLSKAVLFGAVLRRRRLKELWLVRWMVRRNGNDVRRRPPAQPAATLRAPSLNRG